MQALYIATQRSVKVLRSQELVFFLCVFAPWRESNGFPQRRQGAKG
jgi:hypothetical protein